MLCSRHPPEAARAQAGATRDGLPAQAGQVTHAPGPRLLSCKMRRAPFLPSTGVAKEEGQ